MATIDVDALRVQGLYYLTTGLWPIVHLRSFYAVTGAKRDGWLVQTFGVLVAALGLVMMPPRRSGARRVQEEFATAAAMALVAAEATFVARGKISPIYLADAALESFFSLAIRGQRAEGSS